MAGLYQRLGKIEPDRARAGLEWIPRRSIDEATLERLRSNADYQAAVEMLGYD